MTCSAKSRMTSENLLEHFYNKLTDEENPGRLLAMMYCDLLEQKPTREIFIMMNKFVKLYGREGLFFAIVDMCHMAPDNLDKPYGLLRHLLDRRLEKKIGANKVTSFVSLDKDLRKMEERLQYVHSVDFDLSSPFEEGELDG